MAMAQGPTPSPGVDSAQNFPFSGAIRTSMARDRRPEIPFNVDPDVDSAPDDDLTTPSFEASDSTRAHRRPGAPSDPFRPSG